MSKEQAHYRDTFYRNVDAKRLKKELTDSGNGQ